MEKRILCIVLAALIPVALFPVSASADYVFPDSYIPQIMVTIVENLYAQAYNVTSNFSGVSDQSAFEYVEQLYYEYSANASDPISMAVLGAALMAAGTIAVVYDSVTHQGKIALYCDTYVSSLDDFWDYTLGDLGFQRDADGNLIWSETNGVVESVPVFTVAEFPILPITTNSYSDISSNGLTVATNGSASVVCSSNSSDVFVCLVGSTNTYTVWGISPSNTSRLYRCTPPSSNVQTYTIDTARSGYDFYAESVGGVLSGSWVAGDSVPVFATAEAMLSAFDDGVYLHPLTLTPSDFLDQDVESYIIPLPDTTSPDYLANNVIIPTNIDWNPNWGTVAANPTPGVAYRVTDQSVLENALPDIWSQIVSNDVQVESIPSDSGGSGGSTGDPSEVFVPLLPVTLPDFNFSLSGIWYYVVQWVNSIRSWLSLMFSVWASLPQAIVYPVYATAVIVIVLGVYKRFFM